MQLFHYYRSSASYRVRIALALKGIRWSEKPIHLADDQHHSPEYDAISPSHLVPVMKDGNISVAQSLAIIEYIDETYEGPKIIPENPGDRALARELALDIGCEIHPLNNRRVLKYLEEVLHLDSDAQDNWYRHWVDTGLEVIETKFERLRHTSKFCCGPVPTVADCFLVPQIFNARRFNCDLVKFPRVMAKFEDCMALDEFHGTQPSAFDPLHGISI